MSRLNTEQDFWNNIKTGKPDECWEWQRWKNFANYGMTHHFGKKFRAHRLAFYFTYKFLPVAVCHKCDNPPCCNPAHLFAGDYLINNNDRKEKGRNIDQRGMKSKVARLTDDDVIKIRELASKGESHSSIAPIFGVDRSYIGQIVRRKRWKHI